MSAATPFSKILIANRGEIALRVMRSAQALGYATVAVYSTADADARHVQAADQAVCIGEPAPRASYLNIPAIIEAARLSGADAVHPGYGFLAENAAFAAACREAGLVFIGPSPEAIIAMGDKAGAKTLMAEAGVPVIPGYQGEDQAAERLAAEAEKIGWPVMIKATSGGGGRGMRKVDRAEDFAGALQSAQSEALGAFGDATVILERAIQSPRHIEIQVFADRHGHAVHLGERDCSVQRRHQKLIEEAPSPAVSPALREAMGGVAVQAVLSIGFEGAGTLEFLLDAQGHFYFMEMNTRLQVEHPVTEAITGLDLVEWQLRVAAGEPLPLAQGDLRFSGHAIEIRLCAEDALQQFMPQSGTLADWRMPEAGPGALRVEHALRPGDAIPPYYDSMIAKLVAHGANRAEALRRLRRGLGEAVALGVTTNQGFLAQCLAHPVFAEGGATTAFIVEHQDTLLGALTRDGNAATHGRAAALAALLLHLAGQGASGAAHGLAHRLPLLQRFELDGLLHQGALVQHGPEAFSTRLEGLDHQVQWLASAVGPGSGRVRIDGLIDNVHWQVDGARLYFHYAGRAWTIHDRTRAAATRAADAAGDGKLRASMNGRVVALQVALGDAVTQGQPLLTLEAMKMEHVHAAPCAGRVAAVHVSVGDQVAAHRVLVEVVAADGAAQAA